jgi:tetraacyldisaccharide 4'-kinase
MPPRAAPESWARDGVAARLLQPLAWCYAAAGSARRHLTRPERVPVPVICVGNLVAGGAGKTPVALSLARRLQRRGLNPHFLSRGYGGELAGPLRVDPSRHGAADVGDEPLLLAAAAPTWVSRDRVAGAYAAAAAGAGLLIMDDGFQNPSIAKDLALVVIDGGYGFGNRHVMPAGPLREPIAAGLARADAAILVGDDTCDAASALGTTPVLRARLRPTNAESWRDRPVVAFAGIGRPAKFFATLEEMGARVLVRRGFPDHHRYAEAELQALAHDAGAAGAQLVTTEKDAMRLAPNWREKIATVSVEIDWQDETALDALINRKLDHHE